MGYLVQLVRSTPIQEYRKVDEAISNFVGSAANLVTVWEQSLPTCIKLELPYDSGYRKEALAMVIAPHIQDGEWMLFAETVDSSVFGHAVSFLAITDITMAMLGTNEVVKVIMSPVFEAQEEIQKKIDKPPLSARTVDAEIGES